MIACRRPPAAYSHPHSVNLRGDPYGRHNPSLCPQGQGKHHRLTTLERRRSGAKDPRDNNLIGRAEGLRQSRTEPPLPEGVFLVKLFSDGS